MKSEANALEVGLPAYKGSSFKRSHLILNYVSVSNPTRDRCHVRHRYYQAFWTENILTMGKFMS